MTEKLLSATEVVREDDQGAYRKLLNRWIARAGGDHKDLARLTLLVLNGVDYQDAVSGN